MNSAQTILETHFRETRNACQKALGGPLGDLQMQVQNLWWVKFMDKKDPLYRAIVFNLFMPYPQ